MLRLDPERPLLVACSGGADSVALLLLAARQHSRVEAAHFDHQLRPDSGDDAEFTRALCARLGIPFHLRRRDVAALARRWGLSLEAAGRRARYRWLRSFGMLVATAHTLDDQAETVLMRMVEGTALTGLAGIRPRRGDWLVRPLLGQTRCELRRFLTAEGQDWREDPTNQACDRPRTWVRHQLLPLLEGRNPRVRQALAALAWQAREDEACLAALARRVSAESLEEVRQQPAAVRRRVYRRAWRGLAPLAARLGRVHLEGLDALVLGAPGGRATLPGGVLVEKLGGRLHWSRPGTVPAAFSRPSSDRVELPDWGVSLEVDVTRWPQLSGRAWKPGDRLNGKKLKELWAAWQVPRSRREAVLVLVDEEDRPVWVVGFSPPPEGLKLTAEKAGP